MTKKPCLTWDGNTYGTMQLAMPSGQTYAVTEQVLTILSPRQWDELYRTTELRIGPKTAQAIIQQATVPVAA